MKRIGSILLAIFLLAALFAGCSYTVEGSYQLKSINGKNVKEYFSELATREGIDFDTLMDSMNANTDTLGDMMTLTLNADGSASFSSRLKSDEVKTGSWKQTEDKITVTLGNSSLEFTRKNGQLSGTVDGLNVTLAK